MDLSEVDFDVVRDCSDVARLEQMIALLKAEPYYPDLLAAAQDKLEVLSPRSWMANRTVEACGKPDRAMIDDIGLWAERMAAVDRSLRETEHEAKVVMGVRGASKIRSSSSRKRGVVEVEETPNAAVAQRARELDELKAEREKAIGNEYFRSQDYSTAIIHYSKSIAYSPVMSKVAPTAYFNRANANLKLKLWRQAEKDASSAIDIDPKYVKALFLRAKARDLLHKFDDAADDLKVALLLEPDDASVKAQLEALRRKMGEVEPEKIVAPRFTPASKAAPVSRSSRFTRLSIIEEVDEEEDEDEEEEERRSTSYEMAGSEGTIERPETCVPDAAKACKEQGSGAFAKGSMQEAITSYSQSIDICETVWSKDPSKLNDVFHTWSSSLGNRGLVYANLEQHEEAARDYTAALELDMLGAPNNLSLPGDLRSKLHMRRGLLYESLDRIEHAIKDFEVAAAHFPLATQHLSRLRKIVAKVDVLPAAAPLGAVSRGPKLPKSAYELQTAFLHLKGMSCKELYEWLRDIDVDLLAPMLKAVSMEDTMFEQILSVFATFYVKDKPAEVRTLVCALAKSPRISLWIMFLDGAAKKDIQSIFADLTQRYPGDNALQSASSVMIQ